MPLEGQALKQEIIRFCRDRDADLVGFAPVERWAEDGQVPPDFRPRALWPQARTVIVMGMAMPLPIVETTPSVLHMELYRIVNRTIDGLAYALTIHLNRMGHAAFFFGRDVYGSMRALREQDNLVAFGHVMAARYAGLGTIGANHCLLTPQLGPRVRLVSVFTEAVLPPDPVMVKELCIQCGLCAECCPKNCLRMLKDCVIGEYDKMACLEMHEELVRRRCYPCGTCTKVCPIGTDRILYRSQGAQEKYRKEAKALAADPDDPEYKPWAHVRRFGVASDFPERGKKEE